MSKFIKNVMATVVGIFLFLFIIFCLFSLFIGISSLFSGDKTTIADGSVLEIDFSQEILESPSEAEISFMSFDDSPTYYYMDILNAIDKAKEDDRIKGISLNLFGMPSGITQANEIRAKLVDFKKSGKFIYAYGNLLTQKGYYMATVADSIFLNPTGSIELSGLSTEGVFFKDFGDKYGIDFEIIRHGKYKSAIEPFYRNNFSDENKEQLSVLLNDIWGSLSTQMATSRKMSTQEFNVTVDSIYAYIPEDALEHKLVDGMMQESEYKDFLKKKLGIEKDEELASIGLYDYMPTLSKKTSGDAIAVIYASGNIYSGDTESGISSEPYKKMIRSLAKDDNIKGVVLRVNSPGGSANASDEILYELQKLESKKPLIVSFGDYAASGGYYISMAADRIFSEPNCVTGSIGVFGMIPNFKKLANKNGITTDYVETNSNALFYSPLNGLTPDSKRILTKSVESTYNRFVNLVAKNRKKTFAEIDSIAQGRVWSGVKAKENGLVDQLGTLQDAIEYCAKQAKVSNYHLTTFPKPISEYEQLMKQLNPSIQSKSLLKEEMGEEQYKIYSNIKDLTKEKRTLMLNPYKIDF